MASPFSCQSSNPRSRNTAAHMAARSTGSAPPSSAAISRSSGKRSVVSPSSGTVRSKNRQAAANCSRVGSARRASRRETAFPAAHRWASVSASCSRPLAQREGRMSTICSCTVRLPRNSLICK